MPGSILGAAVKRVEDPALLTGRGRFVDDLSGAGRLYACFARSPLAHALIRDLDLAAATRTRGVVGAFAAVDLGLPDRQPVGFISDDFARPALARDRVRFAGEPVAVVVGETRAAAADGAQAVQVDYEPLPVLATAGQAAASGAPLLFPDHGSNVAFETSFGGDGDVLAGAEVVVAGRFWNQRLAAVPMEPNAVAAEPDPETGGLILHVSTQAPFQVRDFVADCLGLREGQVRCIAPDVGGGFGAKLTPYHEQAVVAELARRLGRPVSWIETRTENLQAMTQGRGQVQDVELGSDRSGKFVGLRARLEADAGAYPVLGAFLPYFTGQMVTGVYEIPQVDFRATAYCTNTTPTGAYRGAGRPEASALIERAVDLLARQLDMDPAELRRRNFLAADGFPHETPGGSRYDSGDYGAALERALELAGYAELRREQERRRAAGASRQLGIGLSSYVEITGAGSPTEYASVEARPDGRFLVMAGTSSHGQGHATAYAQLVADSLGVPMEAIAVVEGDTGRMPRGDGTSASRSLQLGGTAVSQSAGALLDRARRLAAELLEADPADLEPTPRGLAVRGAPSSEVTWTALVAASAERGEPALREEADAFADASYPFGAHVTVAEVDLETGDATVVRHVAVDDCGFILNPLLVEGQIHGGVAQGLGQALYEQVVYDADANPLTATLLDYAVPTIGEVPPVETANTVTPSPNNPLGVKGVGEAGTIGSTPAIQNAVIDALAHLGIRHLDMPLTPERVWRAVRDSRP